MDAVDSSSRQQLSLARIRLPPIQHLNSTSRFSSQRPQRRSVGRFDASGHESKSNSDKASFPPLVHPPHTDNERQHLSFATTRHQHRGERITHIEKCPVHPPGKSYAILPPIGGKNVLERTGHGFKKLDVKQTKTRGTKDDQTFEKTRNEKSTKKRTKEISKMPVDQLQSKITVKKTHKSYVKNKTLRIDNAYSVDESEKTEDKLYQKSKKSENKTKHGNRKNDYLFNICESTDSLYCEMIPNESDPLNNDDDVDTQMIGLSQALTEFLDWTPELRDFLGSGLGQRRRNATCLSLDPTLDRLVDKIREFLLKQTLEELGMAW